MDLDFNVRVKTIPHKISSQRPDYLLFPESDYDKKISVVMAEIPLNTVTDANEPRDGATPTEKAVLQAFVASYFYKVVPNPDFVQADFDADPENYAIPETVEEPYDPTMKEFLVKMSAVEGTQYVMRADVDFTDESTIATSVAAAAKYRVSNMPTLADAKLIPGTNLYERPTIALLNYLSGYKLIRNLDDNEEFGDLVYAVNNNLI